MGEAERAEAAAVARRSHGAVSAPPGTKPADVASVVGRLRRAREEPALVAWARRRGLLLPAGPFDRAWEQGGRMEGAEHQVWFDPASGRWWKRNNGSFHRTWSELLERLALHNALFPHAPLRFEGFMQTADGLQLVVTQPDVSAARGATRAEVEALMARFGLRRRTERLADGRLRETDDYEHPDGLRVDDLHDENVLVADDGTLVVIDPFPHRLHPKP
jgi:hypothetical protein